VVVLKRFTSTFLPEMQKIEHNKAINTVCLWKASFKKFKAGFIGEGYMWM